MAMMTDRGVGYTARTIGLEESGPTTLARRAAGKVVPLLTAAVLLCASSAFGQEAAQRCGPAQVIPLTEPEPAAKIVVDPPLPGPLASRGVVVISYCAEHMRIAPVFGPGALAVSPRVGHIHVTVDDAPWHWADASGTPLILRGLPPGEHKVLMELVDANHQPIDKRTVTFVVPKAAAPGEPSTPGDDRRAPQR